VNIQEGTPITAQGKGMYLGAAEAASTDERLLVAQAKAGRSSAFGELYERHRRRIYRTAFRILRNQQDAEDAAQRSFQRAFTNLTGFREDSAFSTWMTRIAINEALMLLRQRRRTRTALLEGNSDGDAATSVFDLPDKEPTPEETLAENELCAAVTQAISRLRKNLRTVVLLREFQGLTSAETARRLGLSVAAVKGRIFHAKRLLRRQLKRKLPLYSVSFSGL
jgi:RNA polymerase sigma-70 factor (ECF subfamily)